MKTSNATGHDSITSKIIKSINTEISPYLTHMINCIIRSSTYPDIFKIANIIPIAKPDEPLDNIESYRPINNLIFL